MSHGRVAGGGGERRRPGPSRRRGGWCAATRTAPPAKGHVLFETGYGPSGLPHIGTFGEVARTTMIRRAFETISRHPDAADLLLRRSRRHAQGAGQRAEPGDAAREPAAAADQRARPVRRARELRARTTTPCCGGSSTPSASSTSSSRATDFYRSGRFDAVLRRAAERYDAIMEVMLREPARGAAADLLDLPADLAAVGAGALRAAEGGERRRRHDHLRRRGRDGDDAAGDRRQREAAVEAGLRGALGGARRRLRDVRQGPFDQHADLRRGSARSSAGGRRSISSTSSSSTRRGRRSPSRRATG